MTSAIAIPDDPIRVRTLGDLVAAVPYLIGFTPERSLVLVAQEGSALASTMRIDLPRAEHARDTGRHLARACALNGVAYVHLLAYEETQGESEAAVRALIGSLYSFGIEVLGRIVVRGDHWWESAALIPPAWSQQRRLDSLENRVAAEFVVRGCGKADRRADLEREVKPLTAAANSDLAQALAWAGAAWDQGLRWPARALWEGLLLDPAKRAGWPDPRELAKAWVALRDLRNRDALVAILLADDAEDRQLSLRALFADLAREIAPRFGRERAAALTIVSVLWWCHGDGARAAIAVEEALSVDPTYSLAGLVLHAISSGVRASLLRGSFGGLQEQWIETEVADC